jgi:hypothetical protein
VTVAKVVPFADDTGEPAPPQIIPALQFLRDLKAIESIVDGLPIPRGGLIAITGPTGAGKTTIATLLACSLCTGAVFAGREVTRGSVLMLSGENPEDFGMHLAVTAQDLGIDGADLSRPQGALLIVPGTFSVAFERDHIERALFGTELVAVVVDTSAAFFGSDDENDNVAMRRHASTLRDLTTLPGNPAVVVLCHPTKSAGKDNLLPRGGGAFLAEIDANLTLWRDEAGIVTLHWAGKIRGPAFDPISFEIATLELRNLVDCRGRTISSSAARHLGSERADQLVAKQLDDQDTVLRAMKRKPGGSLRELAMLCGWTTGSGKPQGSRVDRVMKVLEAESLVTQDRKHTWLLSQKGAKEAAAL